MSSSRMKVRNVCGKNKKRDAFYIIAPLNYCLKLFGLSCIYRDGSNLKQSWSVWKNICFIVTFGIINVISLYSKMNIFGVRNIYTFKELSQFFFLFGYFQYLLDLINVYKYGRDMCLEYYNIYNYIDTALGMRSYGESRRSIIHSLVLLTTVIVTCSAFDFLTLYDNYSSMMIIVSYGIDYMYIVLRNFSMADLMAQVLQVEHRLKIMGDIIEDLYITHGDLPTTPKDFVGNREILKKAKVGKLQNIDQHKSKIPKLCACYLLLLEQCDYINKTYGVRILGTFFYIILDMIISLNYAIRIITGSLVMEFSRTPIIISSGLWTCACGVLLLHQMYRCEQCYEQVARIIRYIDSLLVNKKIVADTRSMLQSLRVLATSRPVVFHAVDFYKLNFSLLLSIVSTVVTYTIILLQNLND